MSAPLVISSVMMRISRLQLVVEAAKLVERDDRDVGRTVRVVHGRPVDRFAVFPDRQLLGDRERLAVADDHADDVVVGRDPAHDERVDAHARAGRSGFSGPSACS